MTLPEGQYTTIIRFRIDSTGRYFPISAFTKEFSQPKNPRTKPLAKPKPEPKGLIEESSGEELY